MQTFLPHSDFELSAQVLDLRRLGKQIVEAGQIYRAIHDADYGWQNHPAVTLWREAPELLFYYVAAMNTEWRDRRGKDHGAFTNLLAWMEERDLPIPLPIGGDTPWWFGNEEFHASHRSNLLRKDPEHYGQFGWTEPDDLEYVWEPTPSRT